MFTEKKLRQAIRTDDVTKAKALLAAHPQLLNKRLKGEEPPLALALRYASDVMVDVVVECGADIDAQPGWTGIHVICDAIGYGRLDYAKVWLMPRPHLRESLRDAKGKWHETLLHVAARRGQSAAMAWLLEEGFDPLVTDADGNMPMDVAIKYDQKATAAFLQPYHDRAARRMADDLMRSENDAKSHARTTGWFMIDTHTVAYARESAAVGYRLTDVFNFALESCTTLSRNLETGAETAVNQRFADMAGVPALTEAQTQLQKCGGQLPALRAPARLRG